MKRTTARACVLVEYPTSTPTASSGHALSLDPGWKSLSPATTARGQCHRRADSRWRSHGAIRRSLKNRVSDGQRQVALTSLAEEVTALDAQLGVEHACCTDMHDIIAKSAFQNWLVVGADLGRPRGEASFAPTRAGFETRSKNNDERVVGPHIPPNRQASKPGTRPIPTCAISDSLENAHSLCSFHHGHVSSVICPHCDSSHVEPIPAVDQRSRVRWYNCADCRRMWSISKTPLLPEKSQVARDESHDS